MNCMLMCNEIKNIVTTMTYVKWYHFRILSNHPLLYVLKIQNQLENSRTEKPHSQNIQK